jgi:hypothetical protein
VRENKREYMNPANENPANENPAISNPAMRNPAMKNPAMKNPAMKNPAMKYIPANKPDSDAQISAISNNPNGEQRQIGDERKKEKKEPGVYGMNKVTGQPNQKRGRKKSEDEAYVAQLEAKIADITAQMNSPEFKGKRGQWADVEERKKLRNRRSANESLLKERSQVLARERAIEAAESRRTAVEQELAELKKRVERDNLKFVGDSVEKKSYESNERRADNHNVGDADLNDPEESESEEDESVLEEEAVFGEDPVLKEGTEPAIEGKKKKGTRGRTEEKFEE